MSRTRILPICILFLALFCLPVTVYAHPGDTDGMGGHTDRDTGEYHYHHGYPAHDHYDIDGDGVADCPYDFQDKTETDATDLHTTLICLGTLCLYIFFMFVLPFLIGR